MSVVIFVRHGRSLTNEKGILNSDLEGFPLTDEGREMIKATATELKKLKVTKIYTSPVQRARESAEILGKELGLSAVVDDRLRERFHGELENTSFGDTSWVFKVDWKHTTVETWDAVAARAKSFLDSVADSDEIIVAVAHDSPIKALLMSLLKLDRDLHMGVRETYASMNIIAKRKRYKVLAINYPILPKALVKKINSYV